MKEQIQKSIIYQSEIDYLANAIISSPSTEIGGELFGFWSNAGYPVIAYISGPGPKAFMKPTFFRQDYDYMLELGTYLSEKFVLQHIGTWHSHHQLGLSYPSGHDSDTMFKAVTDYGLSKFVLLIGTLTKSKPAVKGFTYFDKLEMSEMNFKTIDGISPYRKVLKEEKPHLNISIEETMMNFDINSTPSLVVKNQLKNFKKRRQTIINFNHDDSKKTD